SADSDAAGPGRGEPFVEEAAGVPGQRSPEASSEWMDGDAAPDGSDRPRRSRVMAIASQKGGVGKSTSAVNLGACLAELGQEVLVVDLDPQGNASTGLGIDHAARSVTTYQVIVGGEDLRAGVVQTPVERLWALPS